MASRLTHTILDYSNEQSAFGVEGVTVSSANYDAQLTEAIALTTAIQGIVIGTVAERKFLASVANPESGLPASQYAQRELKWLVTYSDTVNGDIQQCEIACPDLTLLVAGSDLMNLAGAPGLAFVAAFEDFVISKSGNAVNVDSIRLVGRKI